jgi:aryl-alcohol dehydrogenase-like predicted oxidoreductase
MEYQKYGNTDLSVSRICYGTMRYASKNGKHDEQSKAGARALEEAIEMGINFIHSSFEYQTRWLTGSVLAKHPKRHELHHIIKVNVPDWGEPVFDKKAFRGQIEDALRDLQVDRIAIVQHLHRGTLERELGYCAEGEPKRLSEFDAVTGPLCEEFEKLKDEGKVGHLATFPYTVGYGRKAVASGSFSGVVAYFNALETEMLDLFPDMETAGMGFIGIRPFAAGLLTDKRIDRTALARDDRMADEQFDRFYDQLAALRKELPQEPDSWTKFAIQFSLADSRIVSTVVGINSPEQLRTVVDAVSGPYPDHKTLETAHRVCADFRNRFDVKANTAGVPVY